ncbi:MAG: hypothetical protein FWD16_02275 [Clostridia bacterium]|nr:hypothetical protein [Clostridia bacterium]
MGVFIWLIAGVCVLPFIIIIPIGISRNRKFYDEFGQPKSVTAVKDYFEQVAKILIRVDDEMLAWSENAAANAESQKRAAKTGWAIKGPEKILTAFLLLFNTKAGRIIVAPLFALIGIFILKSNSTISIICFIVSALCLLLILIAKKAGDECAIFNGTDLYMLYAHYKKRRKIFADTLRHSASAEDIRKFEQIDLVVNNSIKQASKYHDELINSVVIANAKHGFLDSVKLMVKTASVAVAIGLVLGTGIAGATSGLGNRYAWVDSSGNITPVI